jgi:hypothetical protein
MVGRIAANYRDPQQLLCHPCHRMTVTGALAMPCSASMNAVSALVLYPTWLASWELACRVVTVSRGGPPVPDRERFCGGGGGGGWRVRVRVKVRVRDGVRVMVRVRVRVRLILKSESVGAGLGNTAGPGQGARLGSVGVPVTGDRDGCAKPVLCVKARRTEPVGRIPATTGSPAELRFTNPHPRPARRRPPL